jgi:DNA-binding SARP family transcriptional activator
MTSAPPLLIVTTLGRFAVSRDQQEFSGGNWNRRKVCNLFKLLVSAEQHRLHREQIQEILWPSSTSEQAANSFGKTLYLLRRALEPELAVVKGNLSTYISLTHDTVSLAPEHLQIDADLFETSVKDLQARLHAQRDADQDSQILDEFDRVLHIFGGDYLPEDLYEDWTQKRRDRLHRFHCWLLEHAATLAIAHNMGLRACEYLQTLLEHDVTDEQTHRLLMLVYARMGHRTNALNQFQQLKTILRTELNASPLSETMALLRDIQSGRIVQDLALSLSAFEYAPSPPSVIKNNKESVPPQTSIHKETGAFPQQGTSPLPTSDQRDKKPPRITEKQLETEKHLAGQEDSDGNKYIMDRIAAEMPLVGREEEIQRLQVLYTQSRHGQQHICFISGEPGIGKTRLASVFTSWVKETQHAQVLWGHCYEMSTALPYQPIVDVIETHMRSSTPEQITLLLGSHVSDLAKIVPEIRTKLPDVPCPEQGESAIERYNLYSAVAHTFRVLATERPLVIVLDDVQWADVATFQLLSYLISRAYYPSPDLSPAPFYILLYRANEIHEQHPLRELLSTFSRLSKLQEIHLKRLDEKAVWQLVTSSTGSLPSSVAIDQIYKHTEGNPFFVGQLLLSLIQEGRIEKSGEQVTIDLDKLTLPQSVRILIERRLAHVSPECRTTLMTAAILGRQFNSVLLCKARNLAEDMIAQHVDDAIQLHILMPLQEQSRQEGQTTVRYSADLTFTHDKIREVLYQGLNPLRRRSLHRQVAQAIEALYNSDLAAYYSTLALHYQMAEEYQSAIDYYLKASYQAYNVYAFHDAASHMENVLALLIGSDERPQRAEILHQLAGVYLYLGLTDKAIEAGLAACALWRDLGNLTKEAEARLEVGFALHWQGQERKALVFIKHALECLEQQDEKYLHARAHSQWGMSAIVMGETSEALEQLQRAEELHAQLGGNDPFINIVTLWSRSWHAFLTGTAHEMLTYAQRCIEICRAQNRAGWEPMMTFLAAWAYMLKGEIVEGERIAQETLEQAQKNSAVGPQAWVFLVQTFLAIQSAQWQRAQECSDNALALARRMHDLDLQARVLWGRSILAGRLNDWELSTREITEALQLSQQSDSPSLVYPHLLLQAARAHLYTKQINEAQRYLDEGMRLAQKRQYRQLPALGKRLQGRILFVKGEYDLAQTYFEQSLNELASLGDIVEHARTLEAYGEWYLASRDSTNQEKGRKLIAQSREIFQKLGLKG